MLLSQLIILDPDGCHAHTTTAELKNRDTVVSKLNVSIACEKVVLFGIFGELTGPEGKN